jgi:hypothetical protein
VKLFPRETALGTIGAADFAVSRDSYGAPRVVCSPAARDVLGRNRVASISLSLTHDRTSASAVALAVPAHAEAPMLGRLLYHLLPFRRRVILENLRRVFGDAAPEEEIVRLAQAHYAHLGRLFWEFLWFGWVSDERRVGMVRLENIESPTAAVAHGKGALVLTGHFGNCAVATAAGLASYPPARAGFVVRRPFSRAGSTLRRGGSALKLQHPAQARQARRDPRPARGGDRGVPFDQHAAAGRARHSSGTRGDVCSVAVLALTTGAPVIPPRAGEPATAVCVSDPR